jgi:hypothetical protein
LRKKIAYLLFMSLGLIGGCVFPSKKVESVKPDALVTGQAIAIPTKAFLKDGTIILFQTGFKADETGIKGKGLRFTPGGAMNPPLEDIGVPLDSVAAMTYYQTDIGPGTWVGSALLDLTAPPLIASSIYCLVCPKCCFGSCPTVYVKENDEYQLTAELFSFSVGRLMEADDIDLVADHVGSLSGPFEVRVTNEALETHAINYLQPLAVIHPPQTSVYPDSNNQLLVFRKFLSPSRASNSLGEDVLDTIARADEKIYRSPLELVEQMTTGPAFDHLDLSIKVPPATASVNLLLRMRNSLLSTLLFYDLVLGSQGLEALTWTEKMNTDPVYAGRFWNLYRFFSGITVKVRTETGWSPVGKIHDTGPIAFKQIVARVPTFGKEELEVRLEFVPDNFMIDAVLYDCPQEPSEGLDVQPLAFERVLDARGQSRPDVPPLVAGKDDRYLTTDPGQAYRFFFNLPAVPLDQSEVSVFIASRGFYNEWLRGKWLSLRPNPEYRFDLNDVPGTLRQLAASWLSSKKTLEESFFKARIPIRSER